MLEILSQWFYNIVQDKTTTMVSAIVVALIALISGLLSSYYTKRISDKDQSLKYITEERAKWRAFIRDSAAMIYSKQYGDSNRRAVITKLKLSLNPKKDSSASIDQVALFLLNQIEKGEATDKTYEQFRNCLGFLLKYDWERSKNETQGWIKKYFLLSVVAKRNVEKTFLIWNSSNEGCMKLMGVEYKLSDVLREYGLIMKLKIRDLLRHEMGHTKKIDSFQVASIPFIVFGQRSNDMKTKYERDFQGDDYACVIHKGYNVYFPLEKGWAKKRGYALTEIEDRTVLSNERVKKAVLAPVIIDYTILLISFCISLLSFIIGLCLLFNNGSVWWTTLCFVFFVLSVLYVFIFAPNSLWWFEKEIFGKDAYFYHHPNEYRNTRSSVDESY